MGDTLIGLMVMTLIIVVYGGLFLLLVVSYLLEGIAFFTIAKRRLIQNPWLAFIPIANYWIVGKITEDYDLKQQDIKRDWAKALLVLAIAGPTAFVIMYMVLLITVMCMAGITGFMGESATIICVPIFILAYLGLLASAFILAALGTLTMVCIFKIFESLRPEKALKYMILFAAVPIAGPYLLFKNRNEGYDYLPIEEEEETAETELETAEQIEDL